MRWPYFTNLFRYLQQDEETLEALCELTEIVFANKRVLLVELGSSPEIAAQIEACRGTRMYDLLVQ